MKAVPLFFERREPIIMNLSIMTGTLRTGRSGKKALEPEETSENTVTDAAAESDKTGGEKTGREKLRTILCRMLAVAGIIALILVLRYDMH